MNDELNLDASRCALILQDLQNDVIIESGAFAVSGSRHARDCSTMSADWHNAPINYALQNVSSMSVRRDSP